MSDFRIHPAEIGDVGLILSFVRALAEYEMLGTEVVATEDGLRETLFGDRRSVEVILGYAGDNPVGFAVFFSNYSTFYGQQGIYLEDLFVKPEARGRGYGKALLAYVARLAVERKCGRVEWCVLDWNEPSIAFYKSLGARPMSELTIFRLSGQALQRLAASPAATAG